MKSLNIKIVDKRYANNLKDVRYAQQITEWSINICKTDELRISEPVGEVVPLQDGTVDIVVSYKAFEPTRLEKLYYKYWVGVPVESFAKTMRGN